MRGKSYRKIKEAAPTDPVDLPVAISFLKEHARPSFDETIELHVHLGVDVSKSDQLVRGSTVLPGGAVTRPVVVVVTDDPALQQSALTAGASQAGGEELITEIAERGTLGADVVIATPNMMPKIAKVARLLGPKGLMPNPKTGTVAADPAAAVAELLGGKTSFRMDAAANVHVAVGKISWPTEQTVSNTQAVLQAIREAKPATAKGEYLRSVTLASTMGPGIPIAG